MSYCLPLHVEIFEISEPLKIYKSDLQEQWLSIQPGTILFTSENRSIVIIRTGKVNINKGPDIQDAIVMVDEELKEGDVECHVTASDLFQHAHHNNRRYDKSILHIGRNINFKKIIPDIPTLELKFTDTKKQSCTLTEINKKQNLVNSINTYSHDRWKKKVDNYIGFNDNYNLLRNKLIRDCFAILGVGGNSGQFIQLANNINFDLISTFSVLMINEYLLYMVDRLDINWLNRGIRPAHQSKNRIKLASELVKYIITTEFENKIEYLDQKKRFVESCPSAKGIGIQTELLGNVFIPFFASHALYINNFNLYQKYYSIWNNLKLSTPYRKYIRQYNKIISNKDLRSFPILQGLIEIENQWCNKYICNFCPLKTKHDIS